MGPKAKPMALQLINIHFIQKFSHLALVLLNLSLYFCQEKVALKIRSTYNYEKTDNITQVQSLFIRKRECERAFC